MVTPSVYKTKSIRETMQEINRHGLGIVFVIGSDEKIYGSVTDGDIRRALLRGISIEDGILKAMNNSPIKIYQDWPKERIEKYTNSLEVKKQISESKSLVIPVVDKNEKIRKIGLATFYGDRIQFKPISSISQENIRNINKILVIGGAGYVGSILCRALIKRGYKVKVLDNLLYGDRGIKELYEKDNFTFMKGDVTKITEVVEAMRDIDAVVHLAAIVGDPATNFKPRSTLEINRFSSRTLGEIAQYLGIARFIFASTCSVYGANPEKCDENSLPNPLSLYAETKLASEGTFLELRDEIFSPTILRFATVYGFSPRMRFDLVANLLIVKALHEGKITVYGRGRQMRAFIHVRDIARAIIKVLESPLNVTSGEIFNVGSEDQNFSIKNLAEKINQQIPQAEIELIKEKGDNRSYEVCFDKIRQKLGFKTNYSVEYAVKEIQDAFQLRRLEKDYSSSLYSNYKSLENESV